MSQRLHVWRRGSLPEKSGLLHLSLGTVTCSKTTASTSQGFVYEWRQNGAWDEPSDRCSVSSNGSVVCSSRHTWSRLWLVTEWVRFWIRAAGRSFLRWVTGLVEICRDPRVNLSYCSFGSKEAIWDQPGSMIRIYPPIQMKGDPRVDPQHAGMIEYPIRPWDAPDPPEEAGKHLRRKTSRWHRHPAPDT